MSIQGFTQNFGHSLEVHPIPRTEETQGPYSFIPFLNNLAITFKVRRAMDQ